MLKRKLLFLNLLCLCLFLTYLSALVRASDEEASSEESEDSDEEPLHYCEENLGKPTNDEDDQLIRRLAPYLHMTYRSEKDIENWNCRFCPENFQPPSDVSSYFISSAGLDERMIIGVDDERKEILVIFRGDVSSSFVRFWKKTEYLNGTSEPLNWPNFENFSINILSLQKFELLYPYFQTALPHYLEKYPNHSVVFSGHSYGGSLAFLAALNATSSKWITRATAVAMQPARFAGSDLMLKFQENNIRIMTVVDNEDAVSRWPYFSAWTHFGELKKVHDDVLYDCDGGIFNPFCRSLYLSERADERVLNAISRILTSPLNIFEEFFFVREEREIVARKTCKHVYNHAKFFNIPFYFYDQDKTYRDLKALANDPDNIYCHE